MQTANVIVRLGGQLGNTVPKMGVTPAEILVLKHIHGDESVVDVRPANVDKKLRSDEVFSTLARKYDPAPGAMVSRAGEQAEGILPKLFPGAMKRLPTTLAEIGYEFDDAAFVDVDADEPEEPEQVEQPEEIEDDEPEAAASDEPVGDEPAELGGGAEGAQPTETAAE